MNITVLGTKSDVANLRRELNAEVKKVMADAFNIAKDNTPVRTGNAKKNWKKKPKQIYNRVPYIERLEAGASRQAPKGIIGPTLTQIKGKY